MKNTTRLGVVLCISLLFFIAEIAVGFRTKSLALIADAFHYLNVPLSAIAFLAAYLQDNNQSASLAFTFAYHRAELVGAFFNGVFLLALALSIFLQSLERFINVTEVQDPIMVLTIGCIGLALNIISVLVVHDHGGHSHGAGSHSHGTEGHSHGNVQELQAQGPQAAPATPPHIHEGHNHTQPLGPSAGHGHGHSHGNLGLAGVVVHLFGDAINNIGVIIASLVIWKVHSPERFYADPAASLIISLIIFSSAIPLTAKSGRILLEAAPVDLDLEKVKDDLSTIPNVLSIHDLHVWHLSQSVILASVHVCVSPEISMIEWQETEHYLQQCFAEFGVGHVTISPELHVSSPRDTSETPTISGEPSCEELLGTCRMPVAEGFKCSVGDLVKAGGMRRRKEGRGAA
uniref:Cation efflux protein n=1 Tax=Schizophyllum commune (strain H4-8 / FGSC 9210) TaxID=578458 RepID=D8Q1J1_SCHCM